MSVVTVQQRGLLPSESQRNYRQSIERAEELLSVEGAQATLDEVLQEIGNGGGYVLTIATHSDDIDQSLILRHRLFCEHANPRDIPTHAYLDGPVEIDDFDDQAVHLIVKKMAAPGVIVGYLRLILDDDVSGPDGLYSSSEFDISSIWQCDWRMMELGRLFVIGREHRLRITQMLFRGVMSVASAARRRVLLGCGSFHGTSDEAVLKNAPGLVMLHEKSSMHSDIAGCLHSPRVHDSCAFDLACLKQMLSRRGEPCSNVRLPPPLAFYFANGAVVGRGIALDRSLDTLDVLVLLSFATLRSSTLNHYAPHTKQLFGLDVVGAPLLRRDAARVSLFPRHQKSVEWESLTTTPTVNVP